MNDRQTDRRQLIRLAAAVDAAKWEALRASGQQTAADILESAWLVARGLPPLADLD